MITGIAVVGKGSPPTHLRITVEFDGGDECTYLLFTSQCLESDDGLDGTLVHAVDDAVATGQVQSADGTTKRTYELPTAATDGCACGDQFRVTAHCYKTPPPDGDPVDDVEWFDTLQCDCPSAKIHAADVGDECVDGEWPVTLYGTVTLYEGVDVVTANWISDAPGDYSTGFGDQGGALVYDSNGPPTQVFEDEITFYYDPFDSDGDSAAYEPYIEISYPSGCDSSNSWDVSALGPCAECPEIAVDPPDGITEENFSDGCDEFGERLLTFTVNVATEAEDVKWVFAAQDGTESTATDEIDQDNDQVTFEEWISEDDYATQVDPDTGEEFTGIFMELLGTDCTYPIPLPEFPQCDCVENHHLAAPAFVDEALDDEPCLEPGDYWIAVPLPTDVDDSPDADVALESLVWERKVGDDVFEAFDVGTPEVEDGAVSFQYHFSGDQTHEIRWKVSQAPPCDDAVSPELQLVPCCPEITNVVVQHEASGDIEGPTTVESADDDSPDVYVFSCLAPGTYTITGEGTDFESATWEWEQSQVDLTDQPVTVQGALTAPDCPDEVVEARLEPGPAIEQLDVRDDGGALHDPDDCLEPGEYTVSADVSGPPVADEQREWFVDGELAADGGDEIQVTVPEPDDDSDPDSDSVSVTLRITSDGCPPVERTVTLEPCSDDDTEENGESRLDLCSIFYAFILFGAGLVAFGLGIAFCPDFTPAVVPPWVKFATGIGIASLGLLVAVAALAFWVFICEPTSCDWLRLIGSVGFVAGMLLVYFGFCPGCQWAFIGLLGIATWVLFWWLWMSECRVSRCRYADELVLVLFVFDIIAVVEVTLGLISGCVPIIAGGSPGPEIAWIIVVIALHTLTGVLIQRYDCIPG